MSYLSAVIFLTLKCLILLQPSVNGELGPASRNSGIPASTLEGMEQVAITNTELTQRLMLNAYEENSECSIILSSEPLTFAIGLFSEYAPPKIREYFLKYLRFTNVTQMTNAFIEINKEIFSSTGVVATWTGILYADRKYPFSKDLKQTVENVFLSRVENLDFRNAAAAALTINDWATNARNDSLYPSHLVNPDMVKPDNGLLSLAGSYFTGDWMYPINPSDSQYRKFFIYKDQPIYVPTMQSKGFHKYANLNYMNAQLVEMYFKGGNFSWLIILPNSFDEIPKILRRLSKYNEFQKILALEKELYMSVTVPKVILHRDVNLSNIFRKIKPGVYKDLTSSIFNTSKEGYTYVNYMAETIYIKIDEGCNGQEIVESCNEQKPLEININQPFIFYIMCERRVPIYGGIYNGFDLE